MKYMLNIGNDGENVIFHARLLRNVPYKSRFCEKKVRNLFGFRTYAYVIQYSVHKYTSYRKILILESLLLARASHN